MSPIHVLKFGGTSLQNHLFIKQAAGIVRRRTETVRPIVVVSAIGGVTDQLVTLTEEFLETPREGRQLIKQLKERHLEILGQLIESPDQQFKQLESLFAGLKHVFLNKKRKKNNYKAWRDHVLSFGERASAHIFAAALHSEQISARPVEAYHFIKTDANFGEAHVLPELTRKLAHDALASLEEVAVVTGFIGSTEQNEITTLGRSGSDYTAGLLANALEAEHLEIWTDVDGVLTADPKVVPTAQHIDQLSYEDISELSAHGAKVIHPKTIHPIKERDVSVQVKNSYNPAHPGTLINRSFQSNGSFRSVTVTGPFVYFETSGKQAHQLNILLEEHLDLDEESEEYGFSLTSHFEPGQFLLKEDIFKQVKELLKYWTEEHETELNFRHDLYRVKKFTNRLKESDEPVSRILNVLTRKKIRPLRIHREPNQRYVSLLLPQKDAFITARIINDYLFGKRPVVDLFIAGIGAVGGTLLHHIAKLNQEEAYLRVTGICNRTFVKWNNNGIKPEALEDLHSGQPTHWESIINELTAPYRHNTIFVDATGSSEVARLYPRLLEAGIHIATPSKLANTFEQSFYDTIHGLARETETQYRYETTVGAGLPVISTLTGLLESGDTITEISGVVSGTMTYLFNELEKGTSFSKAVVQARDLGYAEPDPRDDLSGEDVARKFLTMARILGLKLERNQLNVESLIPRDLTEVDRETFLDRLPEVDDHWQRNIKKAKNNNETLRYTGKLKDGKIEIGVESVSLRSPLGQLRGTDNLIHIHSKRYNETPIIIQGPGAGKDVTAAGLLEDILKISISI